MSAAARTHAARALADRLIAQLLTYPRERQGKHEVPLDPDDVRELLLHATTVLLEESSLLDVEGPVTIMGNIHGQYNDLLNIFEECGHPPATQWLCLGNYVNRGANSTEVFCLLLAYKVRFPRAVHLLRGNHECRNIARSYGFYDECKRRYDIRLFRAFGNAFNALPIAAVVNGRIFCVHAGLSPELASLHQIRCIERPTDVADQGILTDLLWGDPSPDGSRWLASFNCACADYGHAVVSEFLQRHDLSLVCRAHQVVDEGYEWMFNRTLVSLFSAPNYCGEFENSGAVMVVDQASTCTMKTFKPEVKKKDTASVA